MKLFIEEEWTFGEAVKAAFDKYTGYGITSKGYRNIMLKSWGNFVKRERALDEFDKYVVDCGGIEKAAENMEVSVSTLKKLRSYFNKLPSRYTYNLEALKIPLILGGSISNLEEDIDCEFKEIKGKRPIDIIKNTVDEYAVAFLNSKGGRIIWGVKNDGIIIGVRLDYSERDDLRIAISNKLFTIQPPIDPTAYKVLFHPIYNKDNNIVPNLFVIEVLIPSSNSSKLFFTGGNETFVRVDGVKKKLNGLEIQDWIIRRNRV